MDLSCNIFILFSFTNNDGPISYLEVIENNWYLYLRI